MIGAGGLAAAFGGRARADLAVPRERLGQPPREVRAPAAALAGRLRRRRVWIALEGARIGGVASARPLAGPAAWEIDTLLGGGGEGALRGLLARAADGARRARATHLLLRLRAADPAVAEAVRAGFAPALAERLWRAPRLAAAPAHVPGVAVREASAADAHDLYRLHGRALPVEARRAIAMTLDEWLATREVRWLGRRRVSLLAAAEDGSPAGAARIALAGGRARLEIVAAPEDGGAARALLAAAAPLCAGARDVLALAPEGVGGEALRAAGFAPDEGYALLARRLPRPAEDEQPAAAPAAAALSGGWR